MLLLTKYLELYFFLLKVCLIFNKTDQCCKYLPSTYQFIRKELKYFLSAVTNFLKMLPFLSWLVDFQVLIKILKT